MRKFFIGVLLLFACSSFAQFGHFASAALLDINNNAAFYNNTAPGLGQNIGSNTYQGTNFGLFARNSGNLKLMGSEIKTFKGSSDNVCSATLNYTIYPVGSRPAIPAFNTINLGFYSDCAAPACGSFFGSFAANSGGGCCSERDQKWQNPGSGLPANIDLTDFAEGSYSLEIYYSFSGEDGGNGCSTTKFDNNSNSSDNYTATFAISAAVPVSFGNIKVFNFDIYNRINWNTFSESNTEKFALQGSNDGITFNTIKEIAAAGFSSTIRNYDLTDMNPGKGNNFYRVKMIETGGHSSYSPIVNTTNKGRLITYIESNPVKDVIRIRNISAGEKVILYNSCGAALLNKMSNGIFMNIDATDLPNGQYFLKVYHNKNSKVILLSVLK